MGELVVRDYDTGQSWVFQPTKEGYAQADMKRKEIVSQGHRVSDDNSGTFGKLGSYFDGLF